MKTLFTPIRVFFTLAPITRHTQPIETNVLSPWNACTRDRLVPSTTVHLTRILDLQISSIPPEDMDTSDGGKDDHFGIGVPVTLHPLKVCFTVEADLSPMPMPQRSIYFWAEIHFPDAKHCP